MELIKMKYRGVEFEASPYDMKVKMSKTFSKTKIPFFSERIEEICEDSKVISGKGYFVGDNAAAQANALMAAFKTKGSAHLFCPSFSPFKAYFTELNLSVDTKSSCVTYSFVFTEDTNSKDRYETFAYTRAISGENLFDVANRCEKSVDELAKVNHIRDIFSLEEGEKLWLK